MTDPIGTAQEVVMLSSVCGHHFADDCQSCASAKSSNDARLQSRIAEVGRTRDEAEKWLERVSEYYTSMDGYSPFFDELMTWLAALQRS